MRNISFFIPRSLLVAVLTLFCAAAIAQPLPCSTVGDAMRDGYKGRVKEVKITSYRATKGSGQWRPDTPTNGFKRYIYQHYNEHGNTTAIEGGTFMADHMVNSYSFTYSYPGLLQKETRQDMVYPDSTHIITIERTTWPSGDNAFTTQQRSEVKDGRDSSWNMGYYISSYLPGSCLIERQEYFTADSNSFMRVAYSYPGDSLVTTLYTNINKQGNTTRCGQLTIDKRHNPLVTISTNDDGTYIDYYTYIYY